MDALEKKNRLNSILSISKQVQEADDESHAKTLLKMYYGERDGLSLDDDQLQSKHKSEFGSDSSFQSAVNQLRNTYGIKPEGSSVSLMVKNEEIPFSDYLRVFSGATSKTLQSNVSGVFRAVAGMQYHLNKSINDSYDEKTDNIYLNLMEQAKLRDEYGSGLYKTMTSDDFFSTKVSEKAENNIFSQNGGQVLLAAPIIAIGSIFAGIGVGAGMISSIGQLYDEAWKMDKNINPEHTDAQSHDIAGIYAVAGSAPETLADMMMGGMFKPFTKSIRAIEKPILRGIVSTAIQTSSSAGVGGFAEGGQYALLQKLTNQEISPVEFWANVKGGAILEALGAASFSIGGEIDNLKAEQNLAQVIERNTGLDGTDYARRVFSSPDPMAEYEVVKKELAQKALEDDLDIMLAEEQNKKEAKGYLDLLRQTGKLTETKPDDAPEQDVKFTDEMEIAHNDKSPEQDVKFTDEMEIAHNDKTPEVKIQKPKTNILTVPLSQGEAKQYGQQYTDEQIDIMIKPSEQRELFKKAIRGDGSALALYNQNLVGTEPKTKEAPNAIPIGEATQVPMGETPADSQALDGQVRLESPQGEPKGQEIVPIEQQKQERQKERDSISEQRVTHEAIKQLLEDFGFQKESIDAVFETQRDSFKKIIKSIYDENKFTRIPDIILRQKAGEELSIEDKLILAEGTREISKKLDELIANKDSMNPQEYALEFEGLSKLLANTSISFAQTTRQAGKTLGAARWVGRLNMYTDVAEAFKEYSRQTGESIPKELAEEVRTIINEHKSGLLLENKLSETIKADLKERVENVVNPIFDEIKNSPNKKKVDLDKLLAAAKKAIGDEPTLINKKMADKIVALAKGYVSEGMAYNLDEVTKLIQDNLFAFDDESIWKAIGGRIKGDTKEKLDEDTKARKAIWSEIQKTANLKSKIDDAYKGVFDKIEQGKDASPEIKKLQLELKTLTTQDVFQQMSQSRKENMIRRIAEIDAQLKTLSRPLKISTTPDEIEEDIKNTLSNRIKARGLQDKWSEKLAELMTGSFKTDLPKNSTPDAIVDFWKQKLKEVNDEIKKEIDKAIAPILEAEKARKKAEKLAKERLSILNEVETASRLIKEKKEKGIDANADVKLIRARQDKIFSLIEELNSDNFKTKKIKKVQIEDSEGYLQMITELRNQILERNKEYNRQIRELEKEEMAPFIAIEKENRMFESILNQIDEIDKQTRENYRPTKAEQKKFSDRIEEVKKELAQAKGEQSKTDQMYRLIDTLTSKAFFSNLKQEGRELSEREKELNAINDQLKKQIRKEINDALEPQRLIELEQKQYDDELNKIEDILEGKKNVIKNQPKELSARVAFIKESRKELIRFMDALRADKELQQQLDTGAYYSKWSPPKEISERLRDQLIANAEKRTRINHIIFHKTSRTGIDKAVDVLGTFRNLKMTADNSVMLVQLLPLIASHPQIWTKAFKSSFESMVNKDASIAINETIRKHPLYMKAVEAGYVLQDIYSNGTNMSKDEAQIYDFSQKLGPISDYVLNPSDRAMASALNIARFELFLEQLETGNFNNADAQKELMSYINIHTGRGRMQFGSLNLAASQKALGLFFNSARMISSTLEDPIIMFTHMKNPAVAKLILKDRAKELSALLSMFVMWAMSFGRDSVDLDPESTTFLRLKIGDTWVNPLGRYMFATRLLLRTANMIGEDAGFVGDGVNDFSISKEFTNFYKYRQAAWIPAITGMLDGRDWNGKKVSRLGLAGQAITPITFDGLYENMWQSQNDPAVKLGSVLYSFIGGATFVDTQEKKNSKNRSRNKKYTYTLR